MAKHILRTTLTLIVLGSIAAVAEGSGRPLRITDPYEYEHFSCKGQPDGRFHNHPNETFGYSGFRIVADLNFDGRKDLILSMGNDPSDGSGGCGNAGCAVTVFLTQLDKSYRSVDFFLHPLAVGSRRVTRGRGLLVTYHHMAADDGSLGTFEVGASTVKLVKMVRLHGDPSVIGSEADHVLPVDAVALHAEYSYCAAGEVQWRGSYE
jgi:hypothetical protein